MMGITSMAKDDRESTVAVLIRRVLEKHPALSAKPLQNREELLGEESARRCQPKCLKNKVLQVVVEDSHWKHASGDRGRPDRGVAMGLMPDPISIGGRLPSHALEPGPPYAWFSPR